MEDETVEPNPGSMESAKGQESVEAVGGQEPTDDGEALGEMHLQPDGKGTSQMLIENTNRDQNGDKEVKGDSNREQEARPEPASRLLAPTVPQRAAPSHHPPQPVSSLITGF